MTRANWILLVDDNVCDACLTSRALTADEFPSNVVEARSGQDALDCLFHRGPFASRQAGCPDLVLLDLKMPLVDGLEVLRQIRADPQLRNIPVVMFTSSREETDIAKCYQSGANAFVVKPVDFHRFTAAVNAIKTFWLQFNEPPIQTSTPKSSSPLFSPKPKTLSQPSTGPLHQASTINPQPNQSCNPWLLSTIPLLIA